MAPRLLKTTLAALAAVAFASLAGCGGDGDDRLRVQAVTVFGDSLSDVGTYAAATGDPANPGKFTVNPGNVWTQNVAAHYERMKARPAVKRVLEKEGLSAAA